MSQPKHTCKSNPCCSPKRSRAIRNSSVACFKDAHACPLTKTVKSVGRHSGTSVFDNGGLPQLFSLFPSAKVKTGCLQATSLEALRFLRLHVLRQALPCSAHTANFANTPERRRAHGGSCAACVQSNVTETVSAPCGPQQAGAFGVETAAAQPFSPTALSKRACRKM